LGAGRTGEDKGRSGSWANRLSFAVLRRRNSGAASEALSE
jgi:hypothetical protein